MKARLLAYCLTIAKHKVSDLEAALHYTREATTSEDKSTAGDKHETGRAMMHLEQEKLQKQLAEAEAIVAELKRLEPITRTNTAQLGALVFTDRVAFFIAAGLGKVHFEDRDYFVVSTEAPIAKAMLGKRSREGFSVNGTEYVITTIE